MTTFGRRETIAGLLGSTLVPHAAAAQTAAPKRGGILRMAVNTIPASGSIHEEMAVATVQPFMPVYNNLVMFDQQKKVNTQDGIVPDLALDWSWSEGNTRITFKLARGVTWHDGKPLTSADVKYTWDTLRKLRNNGWRRTPRRQQFANLEEVTTSGTDTVSFKLARPQPSFMTLLATGFSPVYPEHVDGSVMRRQPIGTGPFKVTGFTTEGVKLVRNPNYWKSGRPYLDGIEWTVMSNAATLALAFVAGKLDIADLALPQMADVKAQAPNANYSVDTSNSHYHVFLNRKRPPFDDDRIRRAFNLTLDRQEFLKVIGGGYGRIGGAMLPPPDGVWGLTPEDLAAIPGYGGDIDANRAIARKLMQEAGHGPDNPVKVQIVTRNISTFVSTSVLVMDHMRKIWIESDMKIVETPQWDIVQAGADWSMLLGSYGAAADDPDVVLSDGFDCKSASNFTDYCVADIQAKIDAQSAMLDPVTRARIVREIDRALMMDTARPVLLHNAHCTCQHPYVRGFVTAANGVYNNWRLEDVWLDT